MSNMLRRSCMRVVTKQCVLSTTPLNNTSLLASPNNQVTGLLRFDNHQTTSYLTKYSPENVLLYTGSNDENPHHKRNLAMSIMYDNLLREIPKLLDQHDYTIYTDDLQFISHFPILRTVHGRQSYKMGFVAWFRSLQLLYTDLYIDTLEVVKEKDCVSARWGICGNTRLNSSFVRVFDGVSTFHCDDDGLVKVHTLDKHALDKWKTLQPIS